MAEDAFDDATAGPPDLELRILRAGAQDAGDGAYRVFLQTTRGDLAGLLYPCEGGTTAVVCVGGASGGLGGPQDLFSELAPGLVAQGVTSFRVGYRDPDAFPECVLDALASVSFLSGIGAERIALVGHSMGGAVVIKAAELSEATVAVVALASQLYGTGSVHRLAPRPLLLVHGMDDQVLEATASQIIYDRAAEPKELVLYEGAGHSLIQCRAELLALLLEWLPRSLRERQSPA